MEKLSANQLSVIEQAHDWYCTLRTAGPAERAAFVEWLKASPRHVGEFLMVTAVYQDHTAQGFASHIDIHSLLQEEESNVVPLAGAAKPAPRVKRVVGLPWAAIAAGGIVALVLGAWALLSGDTATYQTTRGEIRTIELTDGSSIQLNTASQVKVDLGDKGRDIRLLAGEALFTVARDPARPFRVYAGDAVIQAVGTQFNVYRRSEATTVSVLEGRVAVAKDAGAPRLLNAGEEVQVAPRGRLSQPKPVDAQKVTAWRQHLLVFRGETLAAVAAEFNRYNDTPRFVVEDPVAAEKQFTGVFEAKSPESFVRILEVAGDLEVVRDGEDVVVRGK